jgi:hypothetical protein
MLDNLELLQVQEIATLERRVLAEHKPPGMAGSLLQNMGRRPLRLALWGVTSGAEARRFIEELSSKFRAGQPLPFSADIVADSRIERIMIDDLRVQELAGKPQRYAYVLTLREYIEPVAAQQPSALDPDILDDALGLADGLMAGLEIVERLSSFIARLSEIGQRLEHHGAQALSRSG